MAVVKHLQIVSFRMIFNHYTNVCFKMQIKERCQAIIIDELSSHILIKVWTIGMIEPNLKNYYIIVANELQW